MAYAAFKNYGFPKRTGYSISHWLQSVEGDPLLEHRTTSELPQSADVVIIGSGMSGTTIAKNILDTWPERKIVVLEARLFCSGATGRNAGHCKPDQWRGFVNYEKDFGTEQALKILYNEQQTWTEVVRYINENNVDCELWTGDTLDVPLDSWAAELAKETFERYKAAGGKVDHIKVTQDPEEAAKISQIKDAQACYAWPGSTLHPWKFAAHVMRDNIMRGVNLQTNTRATAIIRSEKNKHKWVVKTERGDVECLKVVHASNAYSSALEPSLRGLITPCPHMCNKVVPPKESEGFSELKGSYGVLIGKENLITINPRLNGDGAVLFGGSNPGQNDLLKWLENNSNRRTDDGMTGFDSISKAVQEFAVKELKGWSTDDMMRREETYKHAWSGILGLSADGLPFVGQLPGLPGQWVCAGHHGHGMARIFTASSGLVKLMGGSPWSDTKLPEVFQITAARAEALKEGLRKSSAVQARI
ncbi:conserved hypothetical protein [Talaromyces stipitatus ATCC 10500]|uniref:FAD dependent oxidoreductase domain-containing protein n=1 Tax=Talaromyces stipitatus (strain ATCC 10500 / CBS 375.48 / QM 6759 / NRRL 1006) TaxID=441959 RepID=B8MR74_TALSN|nr:uncharacterized protein TSTA_054790 [Talaromyces stipitatus ATCC 10500]EED12969.1 conserved hypothetical protein [Talaromyces stipitatus ATCC 10500]